MPAQLPWLSGVVATPAKFDDTSRPRSPMKLSSAIAMPPPENSAVLAMIRRGPKGWTPDPVMMEFAQVQTATEQRTIAEDPGLGRQRVRAPRQRAAGQRDAAASDARHIAGDQRSAAEDVEPAILAGEAGTELGTIAGDLDVTA